MRFPCHAAMGSICFSNFLKKKAEKSKLKEIHGNAPIENI